MSDFVPGYESSQWFGVGAPKNTPTEIIDKLNKEINAGLADPKIKTRLADLGATVLAVSPADFGKLIADETEKWGKVVRVRGRQAGVMAAIFGQHSITSCSANSGARPHEMIGMSALRSLSGEAADICSMRVLRI